MDGTVYTLLSIRKNESELSVQLNVSIWWSNWKSCENCKHQQRVLQLEILWLAYAHMDVRLTVVPYKCVLISDWQRREWEWEWEWRTVCTMYLYYTINAIRNKHNKKHIIIIAWKKASSLLYKQRQPGDGIPHERAIAWTNEHSADCVHESKRKKNYKTWALCKKKNKERFGKRQL